MEDYTSHRSDAVKVVRFGLKPQTDAAVASKPPKTDVLRANFYTDAIDPVFVIAICASAIHPLITGRCKNHSAIARARYPFCSAILTTGWLKCCLIQKRKSCV